MPVVTIAMPAHAAVGELLVTVAAAIADSLALADGGVIVTHVPTGMSATSGADTATEVGGWPIVTIGGSDRGRERMEAARTAAEIAVRSWSERHGVECEGVWTQWSTPLPA